MEGRCRAERGLVTVTRTKTRGRDGSCGARCSDLPLERTRPRNFITASQARPRRPPGAAMGPGRSSEIHLFRVALGGVLGVQQQLGAVVQLRALLESALEVIVVSDVPRGRDEGESRDLRVQNGLLCERFAHGPARLLIDAGLRVEEG